MRALLDIAATVCIGWMIGAELTVAVLIHPTLSHLDDRAQVDSIRLFARKLGAIMPFWYAGSFVLLIVEVITRWNEPGRKWLVAAGAIWIAVIVLTLLFLVPINDRIAKAESGLSPESFQQQHRTWDRRHRWRVAALAVAMVCFLYAIQMGR